MSKPIIEVAHIYKKYRIGLKQPYYSLRDSLAGFAKHPLNFLKARKRQKDGLAEDEFWALRDISFKVMPGEVIGIIGRNGAGKTTLLKILSKITPPTKGEIVLRGRIAGLLEVGTGFHPELTGRENIFLNGAILGMSRNEIKKKFDEIVDFSDIEKFLDTPVKYYSSGMYMRLAFSVAAHLEPEILIVDEVLAVGDDKFQKKCLGKMDEVSKSGKTILFVSHNMTAIRNLCPRTILVNLGRIKSFGKTDKVIEKYISHTEDKNRALIFRKDRAGNHKLLLRSISLVNQHDSSIIKSFDRIFLTIKLEKKNTRKVSKIQVKIAFLDQLDRPLFRIDSDTILWKDVQNNTLKFATDNINLVPMVCSLNIGIFTDGELSDYIKNAYSFTIIGSNRKDITWYSESMATILMPYKNLT